MEGKAYDKALVLFDLDYKSKNKEVLEYKDMIKEYLYSKKLFNENKIEEAKNEIKKIKDEIKYIEDEKINPKEAKRIREEKKEILENKSHWNTFYKAVQLVNGVLPEGTDFTYEGIMDKDKIQYYQFLDTDLVRYAVPLKKSDNVYLIVSSYGDPILKLIND